MMPSSTQPKQRRSTGFPPSSSASARRECNTGAPWNMAPRTPWSRAGHVGRAGRPDGGGGHTPPRRAPGSIRRRSGRPTQCRVRPARSRGSGRTFDLLALRERIRQYADQLQHPVSTLQSTQWLRRQTLIGCFGRSELRRKATRTMAQSSCLSCIIASLTRSGSDRRLLSCSRPTPLQSRRTSWHLHCGEIRCSMCFWTGKRASISLLATVSLRLLLGDLTEELRRIARTSSAGVPDVLDDLRRPLLAILTRCSER